MGFPFIFQDKKCQVENPKPDLTLAEYLRDTLHLTGTKIACGSSGCGSCTVILSRQAVFEISSHFISNYSLYSIHALIFIYHANKPVLLHE